MATTTGIDLDIFSTILAHVHDTETVHTILRAISKNHPFFLAALTRLLQLPVILNFFTNAAQLQSDTKKIIGLLINDNRQDVPLELVNLIRHLVIYPDATDVTYVVTHRPPAGGEVYWLLVSLFERAVNLRTVDWCEASGPTEEQFMMLQKLKELKEFSLICDPHGGRSGNIIDGDKLDYDPTLLSETIGPSLRKLTLRLVNSELYRALVGLSKVFRTYHSLRSLFIDVTAGVWDWDGRGSPQEGATNDFIFDDLGFPAVKDFILRVSDLTLSGPKPGPLSLVNPQKLEQLTLQVEPCFSWIALRRIKAFEALQPTDYSALKRLQIIDSRRDGASWYWPDELPEPFSEYNDGGRCYWGLVPHFLSSIRTGNFQHLTQLWVDQNALSMPTVETSNTWDGNDTDFYKVTEIWEQTGDEEEDKLKREWVEVLKTVFSQLESLRVGFGDMDEQDVQLILGCCSPERLSQFGFRWIWEPSKRDDPIPRSLLKLFKPFKKLTDVHILQPRPGTRDVFRSISLVNNRRTIEDIESIFASHPSICRVGWGRLSIWERNCSPISWVTPGTSPRVVQVLTLRADDRDYGMDYVPDFYGTITVDDCEDVTGGYQARTTSASLEIRALRELLERTLPSAAVADQTD